MDDFFSVVSKGVIIIPIVILVLSLLMKFNQKTDRAYLIPTIAPTVAKKINLDLNGSFVCQYENNGQKYYLSVKNKKIDLKITTAGQTKKYDLSQYSGLLENLINYDVSQLESMAKPYLPEGVDLKTLVDSCKRN